LERRLNTIRKQREGFAKLRERVTGVRGEMEAQLRKVLRLRPGEDLPEGLRDALEEVPSSGYRALSERLEKPASYHRLYRITLTLSREQGTPKLNSC
jgi:hypothetical protein